MHFSKSEPLKKPLKRRTTVAKWIGVVAQNIDRASSKDVASLSAKLRPMMNKSRQEASLFESVPSSHSFGLDVIGIK